MRLESSDLREMNLLKYYRIVRKWACKTYGLKDADLELLIYLDCMKRFNLKDYKAGTYAYVWDKHRWQRLRREGWIDVWRHRNHTTRKYAIFQTSYRCKQMINRVYRILLGLEDPPVTCRSAYFRNKTYTEKTHNKVIDDMIKDKDR